MENIRYKILLIEDDKLDQMAFTRLVEDQELPYNCKIAGSVSEAKSMLSSEKFDIIIADYSLGDGTAFDILDLAKDTPIIVVTGAGSEEIANQAWRAGAYDYLIKDIDRNYLKTVEVTVENAVKHKRTEEKLRLLSHAIVSTDDSVYITNMENKITFVNRAFCETYGYKEEDIIGKDCDILWKGSPLGTNVGKIYRAVSGWEVGFFHKRKDGSEFPVSLSRSVIKDESGNEVALVAIARDISERMQFENELRAANLRLDEQNRLKSELAITACQESMTLLTELTGIVSNAITNAPEKAGSKFRKYLELAENDIVKLARTISDFLDISQLSAGKVKLELSELSLHPIVSQVIESLSPLADERHLELKSIMPDSELIIEADHNRIAKVLRALVNNAIRSASPNCHICVQARNIGKEIMVEVKDDSPPIESSDIDTSFDRFNLKPHPVKEQQLALGLSIARELVEMHGGCLWAETGDERGNCISFTLPKSGVKQVAASVAAKAAGNH